MNSERDYYTYLSNRSRLSLFVRRFFIQDLTRHFDGRVLDVGCGIGEFLKLYSDGIGIDLNPYLVKLCQQKSFPCSVADSSNLPFPSEHFDGVLASNILEHLSDVEATVAEIARVLKPGGTFVATVPLEAGFRHDQTHIHMLNEDDLLQIAGRFEFRPRLTYRYPFRSKWPGKFLYFCELRGVFTKMAL
jgi:SAM-dependent methyltransferase